MEIWKDVQGYEGTLQVSNLGNVKTLDRVTNTIGQNQSCKFAVSINIKGIVLNQRKKKNGYLEIAIRTVGKRKWFLVHRLVAQAFIDKPENLNEINHKDGNKENNNMDNLEWCNRSQNLVHALKLGLCKNEEKHYKAKLTKEQVRSIIIEEGYHWEIAEKYGVNRSTITAIKARKTWKYIGD